MTASDLFDVPVFEYLNTGLLSPSVPPWEWVYSIKEILKAFDFTAHSLPTVPSGVRLGSNVYIHHTVELPPYACIDGPCYIGAGTIIRPGAYIREHVIIGPNCVIGTSCELKNALLMEEVRLGHFNYVGDSILGRKVHLGAGAVLSNLRLDEASIHVTINGQIIQTHLRKLGALLGENVQVGSNVTLQPGTLIAKDRIIYNHPSLKQRLLKKSNVQNTTT